MDRSTTLELAAVAATVLAAIGVVPQLRRLLQSGDVAGLSLSFATLGMASELAWVGYTLHGRLWSAVLEPVLMTMTNATLAVVMVRAGMSPWRGCITGLLWGGALASAAVLFGVTALAALLPLAYAVQVTPSIWSAYRACSPSGVAAANVGARPRRSAALGCLRRGSPGPRDDDVRRGRRQRCDGHPRPQADHAPAGEAAPLGNVGSQPRRSEKGITHVTDSRPEDRIPDVAEAEAEAIAREISAEHVEEEGRLTAPISDEGTDEDA